MSDRQNNTETSGLTAPRFQLVSKEKIRKAASAFGLFSAAATVAGAGMLYMNAEMRSEIFFSEPVQQVFAAEMDLLSTGLAAGGPEVSLPVQQAAKQSVQQAQPSKGESMVPVRFESVDHDKPLTAGQEEVARYLSKKYRVSSEAIESLVRLAWKVGKDEKVEPTLILAISGIESSYNPFAASSVGAKGLMQVMAHIHKDKFEALSPGDWTPLNPELNMRVGSKIIREYTRRTGSVRQGLRWYVGAAIHGNDGGYPDKVLGLKSRIDSAYQKGRVVAQTEQKQAERVSAVTMSKDDSQG